MSDEQNESSHLKVATSTRKNQLDDSDVVEDSFREDESSGELLGCSTGDRSIVSSATLILQKVQLYVGV